ncbi:N-6 DNA methylase [Gordonia sp. HY285]|uniref:Eco57I restriction-modification methylase domain-containing protein n=1 Tax=Gordonia liuliyuniae TaxID=2911517 RepID=UPI001F02F562|nr:N-6 DNA methylase [Gordonia liuliyuniae]MCF8608901.1 N-6 DNA methylase [Gordonia liuliyuniae]
MSTRQIAGESYVGVRIQGGLLPADLPSQLAAGHDPLGKALEPRDYHLAAGETVRDAANRAWAYLCGVWTGYRDALSQLPEGAPTTGLTRERFLLILLKQLDFGQVPASGKGGIAVDGRNFPVSHEWGSTPIHLLGWGTALDTRSKGVAGAAGSAPQSMVQELLNHSDDHLWAILSNGQVLRLLRDSTSLVGSAYVEFDLEAIFDGELFSDFLLLYTLCHVSRFEVRDDSGPASCPLEQWRTEAVESGSRALNQLRDGVVEALQTLGIGFLTHPQNATLREDLASERLSVNDVNHALLRVVYRLLFTFVAEDRQALLDPNASVEVRQRYLSYFSTARLRATARRRRGGRYGDRWEALTLVWRGLGSEEGLPELGLPGIGGLFDNGELDFLTEHALSNDALLSAVKSLSLVRESKSSVLRVVDYRNLGAEELGSIYEALLEFVPQWDPAKKEYSLNIESGNQRKDTGSYYTPSSLVESLLDTALEPVLDDAFKSADTTDGQIQALLSVTVCDPACGSGHFLVGAARRIAKRVAAARTGDPEPAPAQVRAAMREVVAKCIYGVDVNPLAAELAKVSLWMEALEPGKPLTYLDAQIKVGNTLVGATPKLLADGLPDAAFKPIEGDVKQIATATTRANKAERSNQASIYNLGDSIAANTGLAKRIEGVIGRQPLSLADVHAQSQRLRAFTDSQEYLDARLIADAWCAAFVWPLQPDAPTPITQATIAAMQAGVGGLTPDQTTEVSRLAAEYGFFHWHLEFPHLFPTIASEGDISNNATGWDGGFSAVLGNPPWERVKLQKQEFFAARDPEVAAAPNASARKRLITQLPESNNALYNEFLAEKRRAEGMSHILRNSGRYPLTGRGDINTYAVFAEASRNLMASKGRLGEILPTNIATDATTQYFFKDLVTHGAISSLYDFENSNLLFVSVHSSTKFCLLSLVGRDAHEARTDFAFFAHDPLDLQRPNTRFTLSPDEIALLNPNTGTCPVFRSRRDAEITLSIYKTAPVLINASDPVNGNPWGVKFMRMFDMSNDSHLFRTREYLEADGWTENEKKFKRDGTDVVMLPLYQGMMASFYNHRAADVKRSATATKRQNQPSYITSEELKNPRRYAEPAYWVSSEHLPANLPPWLLGFSNVSSPTNERTMVAYPLPKTAVGHSVPLIFSNHQASLLGLMCTYVFDYVLRQKLGGINLTYNYLQQLPMATVEQIEMKTPWDPSVRLNSWISSRVFRLSYTAYDMHGIADDLSPGSEPHLWDDTQREQIRAELDAAAFHIFKVSRNDASYILDTFTKVASEDIQLYGEYRTKRMILERYDLYGTAAKS